MSAHGCVRLVLLGDLVSCCGAFAPRCQAVLGTGLRRTCVRSLVWNVVSVLSEAEMREKFNVPEIVVREVDSGTYPID